MQTLLQHYQGQMALISVAFTIFYEPINLFWCQFFFWRSVINPFCFNLLIEQTKMIKRSNAHNLL